MELLDFVSHCTCPIVHAADDLSVMQSLEALPHIARSARAIIGKEKAYWIGPSTIGMRHNPYGARVMENPANCRVAMTDRDPRQTSLFAAAWMIGFVAGTAEAALQTLTVGSLTGRLGLSSAEVPGQLALHPAFYTARGLAELGGNLRYECRLRPSGSCGCYSRCGSNRNTRRLAGKPHRPKAGSCACMGICKSILSSCSTNGASLQAPRYLGMNGRVPPRSSFCPTP